MKKLLLTATLFSLVSLNTAMAGWADDDDTLARTHREYKTFQASADVNPETGKTFYQDALKAAKANSPDAKEIFLKYFREWEARNKAGKALGDKAKETHKAAAEAYVVANGGAVTDPDAVAAGHEAVAKEMGDELTKGHTSLRQGVLRHLATAHQEDVGRAAAHGHKHVMRHLGRALHAGDAAHREERISELMGSRANMSRANVRNATRKHLLDNDHGETMKAIAAHAEGLAPGHASTVAKATHLLTSAKLRAAIIARLVAHHHAELVPPLEAAHHALSATSLKTLILGPNPASHGNRGDGVWQKSQQNRRYNDRAGIRDSIDALGFPGLGAVNLVV